MSLVEDLIIVFGVLCGVLVTLLVFLLWKYVNNVKQTKEQYDEKPNTKNDFPAFDYTQKADEGVNVSWKLVAPQISPKAYSPLFLKIDQRTMELSGSEPRFEPNFFNANKPVNPTISALKGSKHKSKSLTSLDVNKEVRGERLRRCSYGSDVSDISQKSSHIVKQEKICNQMLADIRSDKNDKRRDSSLSIAKYGGSLSFDDAAHVHQQLDTSMGSDCASSAAFDSDVPLDESLNKSSHISMKRKRLGRRRGSHLTGSMEFKIVGKLTASIEYSETERALNILIHKASGLGGDRKENPDISSFVKLFLIPNKKQKQKSSVIRGTKDPEFKEKFTFTNLPVDELSGQKLKLRLYNSMLVKDEFLGEANIFLGSINKEEKEVYHLHLLKKKSKISSSSIEISLCHQGTYSKLEVIIHQAKNLIRKNNARINPYAKASFYKDGTVETKETAHQMNERNPVFNESFDFKANTDAASPLSTYSLVVTLMHHSLFQKDSRLGHVIFTINSPQESAEKHLKQVENEPHLRVTEWHKLIDPEDV